MRILVTGAGGFLGWHTRLRLHALTDHEIFSVTRSTWSQVAHLVEGVDAVIHLAGVNRGPDDEVHDGNLSLADDVATAVEQSRRPIAVVYANSIQDSNGSPYGLGKAAGRHRLEAASAQVGGRFVDVRLPNLFGEHGRPGYNSFVATFVAATIAGEAPSVVDRPVELLHAQGAAAALIEAVEGGAGRVDPRGTTLGVAQTLDVLHEFKASYDSGEIPDLCAPWRVDLFNTYRAALFPTAYPIGLTPHSDPRGRFVETLRSRGGQGQSSFSTTVPGITRGEHYHLRKIERFSVIGGEATISLRRMFTDEVIDFPVTGDRPCAVDMPTGWVHNITNTGTDLLHTFFWSHELFDPADPDTYPERVRPLPTEA